MQITKNVANLPKNPNWVLAPDKALISFATARAIYCRAVVSFTHETLKAMLLTFDEGLPLFHEEDRRKFKYYKPRSNQEKELWLPLSSFVLAYRDEGYIELSIDSFFTDYKISHALFHRYSNFSLTSK